MQSCGCTRPSYESEKGVEPLQTVANKKRIPLATPHLSGEEMIFINEALDDNWIVLPGHM